MSTTDKTVIDPLEEIEGVKCPYCNEMFCFPSFLFAIDQSITKYLEIQIGEHGTTEASIKLCSKCGQDFYTLYYNYQYTTETNFHTVNSKLFSITKELYETKILNVQPLTIEGLSELVKPYYIALKVAINTENHLLQLFSVRPLIDAVLLHNNNGVSNDSLNKAITNDSSLPEESKKYLRAIVNNTNNVLHPKTNKEANIKLLQSSIVFIEYWLKKSFEIPYLKKQQDSYIEKLDNEYKQAMVDIMNPKIKEDDFLEEENEIPF